MLKRTSCIKLLLIAVLAAGLYGCANGNGEVSSVNNGHGEEVPGAFGAASLHGPLAKSSLTTCQACHAGPTYGVNPRFNVPHLNIPTGCETCHETLTSHPTPWLLNRVGTPFNVANATSHANAGSFTSCTLCHGALLDGIGGTAPSCMSGSVSGISCHAIDPTPQTTACVSCHRGSPVGPDGITAPNRAFAHAKHIQLNLTCDNCHQGGGFGAASHADGAPDVVLAATYKANVISFSYSSAGSTCSGVSCHGGQTTPNWQTGSLTVSTDCGKCHEYGTVQNNSYSSGKHQSHLVSSAGSANQVYRLTHPADITCTDCHSLSKLTTQMHFGGLATAGFTNPPRDTIGGAGTKLGAQDYVAPTYTTSCATTACHASGRRDWNE